MTSETPFQTRKGMHGPAVRRASQAEVPIIDFGALYSPSVAERRTMARAVRAGFEPITRHVVADGPAHRRQPPDVLALGPSEVLPHLHLDPWYALPDIAGHLAHQLGLGEVGPAAAAVHGDRLGIRSQQPVERHSKSLCLEVPQSYVHPGYGEEGDPLSAVAPHVPEHVLPKPLYAERVLADEDALKPGLHNLPDSRRRLADAQPFVALVRVEVDEELAPAAGRCRHRGVLCRLGVGVVELSGGDVGDLQRWHSRNGFASHGCPERTRSILRPPEAVNAISDSRVSIFDFQVSSTRLGVRILRRNCEKKGTYILEATRAVPFACRDGRRRRARLGTSCRDCVGPYSPAWPL